VRRGKGQSSLGYVGIHRAGGKNTRGWRYSRSPTLIGAQRSEYLYHFSQTGRAVLQSKKKANAAHRPMRASEGRGRKVGSGGMGRVGEAGGEKRWVNEEFRSNNFKIKGEIGIFPLPGDLRGHLYVPGSSNTKIPSSVGRRFMRKMS